MTVHLKYVKRIRTNSKHKRRGDTTYKNRSKWIKNVLDVYYDDTNSSPKFQVIIFKDGTRKLGKSRIWVGYFSILLITWRQIHIPNSQLTYQKRQRKVWETNFKQMTITHVKESQAWSILCQDQLIYIFSRENEGYLTLSDDKNPYYNRKFESQSTTQNAIKNFDYTMIAARTVSMSNNNHPPDVVKPVYGYPTFPVTAKAV